MDMREQLVQRPLEVAGTTYAAEAGIRINDKPMTPQPSATSPRAPMLACPQRSSGYRWTTTCAIR